MIVSVSRRTDIPAYYVPWLRNRLKEGFALVRNPRNFKRTRFVSLAPGNVDCFVFWTKDARPLFGLLDMLDDRGTPYFFQWTVTPYGPDIEPGIAPKADILAAFRALSERIGPHRTIWRYDPVFVGDDFPVCRHLEAFERMCASLSGAAGRCVLSFVDLYAKMSGRGIAETSREDMKRIAGGFAKSAAVHGISLQTCCEETDFEEEGIRNGACIDGVLVERLAGRSLGTKRDRNQRPLCGCAESADIGAYDTCPAGCLYCYANRGGTAVRVNTARHNPESPLLAGMPSPDEERFLAAIRGQEKTFDISGLVE
jgi:hypothetical protein